MTDHCSTTYTSSLQITEFLSIRITLSLKKLCDHFIHFISLTQIILLLISIILQAFDIIFNWFTAVTIHHSFTLGLELTCFTYPSYHWLLFPTVLPSLPPRLISLHCKFHNKDAQRRVGPPLPSFSRPCPVTSPSFGLFLLFPFSFSRSLYLFSSFVHPVPFSTTVVQLRVSRPEVVGGDRTWV